MVHAAKQDRFGQSAMHGDGKTFDVPVHQISTPPPNEKNARKKLDAAKAKVAKLYTRWEELEAIREAAGA